ncbi:MAG: hypothetical protein OEV66_02055 [Spirochaetia bacterium]|nr:hypothetical protein [Spirochaetia bacterium]
MKKLIFLTLISVFFFGSCIRTFRSYASDGKGGVYRVGSKLTYVVFGVIEDPSLTEYCKPTAGGALNCKTVKVTAPGIIH